MLTRMSVILDSNKKKAYHVNAGRILNGFLKENISKEFVNKIHENPLNPYSQYLRTDNDNLIWTVSTLDDIAKKEIIDKLSRLDSIKLQHKNDKLNIKNIIVQSTTYAQLFERIYSQNPDRNIKIKFVTPTSFKSKEEYMIYPTAKWFFQSIVNKFNSFAENIMVSRDITVPLLENVITIKRYNLRSTKYFLGDVKIPSFFGEVECYINAPQHIVNMVHMLAEFAEYSGVGIKTTLGMGGIEVIKSRYSD